MGSKPTKTEIRRIAGAIKRSKKKVIHLDALSRLTGLYPDVLGEKLREFEPMILLDDSINCRDLLPRLEEYLEAPSENIKRKPASSKAPAVRKKDLAGYSSIADFVYKKMTSVGGLVDTSARLSDEDLALLKRLIENEQKARKKGKGK